MYSDLNASPFILHGIVHSSDSDRIEHTPDVFGRGPISMIRHAGLVALASRVPATKQKLFEDAEEVQSLAIAHNDLLVSIVEKTDVVPVRLGALYSSVSAVEQFLDADERVFLEVLEQTRNCVEYSVEFSLKSVSKPESQMPTTGRGYLKARSAHKNHASNRVDEFQSFVNEAIGCLEPISKRAVVTSAENRRTTIVVLTDRGPSEGFLKVVEGLNEKCTAASIDFKVTGPWPIYSFVEQVASNDAA